MSVQIIATNKVNEQDPLVKQIDELQRLSEEERDDRLGSEWFQEVKDLYTLEDEKESGLSFRPNVCIPQLQVLMLNEATDLSDNSPRIIITNRNTQDRDKPHEDALMAQWNAGFWNNQIMLAELWSLFASIGYLQVGFDRLANRGQGAVWVRSRDPKTVFPDPGAQCDEDWAYLLWEDRLYLDEIVKRWPDRGRLVKPKAASPKVSPESNFGLQMPPGPMSMIPGLPGAQPVIGDGRCRVRHLIVKDSSVEEIKNQGADVSALQYRPKFPEGRYIVECEGVILVDGDNPAPFGWYPMVSVVSMPRLNTFYPPSAVRYSRNLQGLAERMFTQLFENAVRLNNGIVVVNEASGINIDAFGGLPAEVVVVSPNGGTNPIQILTPPPFPQHFVDYPKMLLDIQKLVQGFTPSRMGEPSQGNVSKDLYGMGIYESQKLTRMRGRLMAESVQRLAELVFFYMAKFYVNNNIFPVFKGDAEANLAKWSSIDSSDLPLFDVHLDPASIRPVSESALRSMVPWMRQMGLIDTESALDFLNVPGKKEIAQNITQEQQLQALNGIQKGR